MAERQLGVQQTLQQRQEAMLKTLKVPSAIVEVRDRLEGTPGLFEAWVGEHIEFRLYLRLLLANREFSKFGLKLLSLSSRVEGGRQNSVLLVSQLEARLFSCMRICCVPEERWHRCMEYRLIPNCRGFNSLPANVRRLKSALYFNISSRNWL